MNTISDETFALLHLLLLHKGNCMEASYKHCLGTRICSICPGNGNRFATGRERWHCNAGNSTVEDITNYFDRHGYGSPDEYNL